MLNELRLKITDFLNIILIDNNLIFLNVWSIVHFLSGMVIMYILLKTKLKFKFLVLFGLLVSWEFFEFINYGIINSNLFIAETIKDIIYDIVYGLLGASLMLFIHKIGNISNSENTEQNNTQLHQNKV